MLLPLVVVVLVDAENVVVVLLKMLHMIGRSRYHHGGDISGGK